MTWQEAIDRANRDAIFFALGWFLCVVSALAFGGRGGGDSGET